MSSDSQQLLDLIQNNFQSYNTQLQSQKDQLSNLQNQFGQFQLQQQGQQGISQFLTFPIVPKQSEGQIIWSDNLTDTVFDQIKAISWNPKKSSLYIQRLDIKIPANSITQFNTVGQYDVSASGVATVFLNNQSLFYATEIACAKNSIFNSSYQDKAFEVLNNTTKFGLGDNERLDQQYFFNRQNSYTNNQPVYNTLNFSNNIVQGQQIYRGSQQSFNTFISGAKGGQGYCSNMHDSDYNSGHMGSKMTPLCQFQFNSGISGQIASMPSTDQTITLCDINIPFQCLFSQQAFTQLEQEIDVDQLFIRLQTQQISKLLSLYVPPTKAISDGLLDGSITRNYTDHFTALTSNQISMRTRSGTSTYLLFAINQIMSSIPQSLSLREVWCFFDQYTLIQGLSLQVPILQSMPYLHSMYFSIFASSNDASIASQRSDIYPYFLRTMNDSYALSNEITNNPVQSNYQGLTDNFQAPRYQTLQSLLLVSPSIQFLNQVQFPDSYQANAYYRSMIQPKSHVNIMEYSRNSGTLVLDFSLVNGKGIDLQKMQVNTTTFTINPNLIYCKNATQSFKMDQIFVLIRYLRKLTRNNPENMWGWEITQPQPTM